jgi:hypothetical protein
MTVGLVVELSDGHLEGRLLLLPNTGDAAVEKELRKESSEANRCGNSSCL